MKFVKCILILLILISTKYFPQVTISGKITDLNNNPLPSANIYIKDSYDGVSSEQDGTYSFTTLETGEKVLIASYVGYLSEEINIIISKNNITHDFRLKEVSSSLNTVVISAGSFEASDEKKSVILKPMDIVTTGTTADIYSALATLPGTQQIGEQVGLFVRGGSAAETKTIIDDMVVQSPFYSTVPDVASRGRFSPFLFKGTIFSTGGYSARYGQALSSALILNSTDLAPSNATSLNIMAVGLGASHTQRWENSSIAAELGYYNLEPYYKVQKTRLKWDSAPSTTEGQIIFRHKFNKTGIFKLYTSYNDDNLGLFIKNLDNLSLDDKYQLKNNNFLINSSYSDIIAGEWTLSAGLSYGNDINKIDINTDKIKTEDQLLQSKLVFSRRIMEGTFLTFGGEIHNRRSDQNFNIYNRNLKELFASAFAESDIFFTNDIALRLGLRVENSDLLKKMNFAPRTSLAYKLGKYDQINIAYGIFYQNPENDLLFQSTELNFEKADHYIANYQYIGENITFRLEGYYKNYYDLAKITENVSPNSTGKGYAKGIDVFLRGNNLMDNSDFWVSYSLLDTKRDYRNFPFMAAPDFASPHTFSAVYKKMLAFLPGLLGITYTWASGRPYYNPNNPQFHSDKTGSYSKMDLNLSYLTNLFNNFTVIFFSVDNVFGINNVFSYRYSSDGKIRDAVLAPANRSVFIGMFISLGETFSGI